ncbi:hypothetical protein BDZ97DRAFT_1920509 [Flammula alnicola]|nr:hypothetical protein BDZ97DRAFT_1920509 [Flammula alnicola]
MDVISLAATVCTLCKAIQTWIDQQAEKEALLTQISSTVLQIHNILLPFASTQFKGTGELQLSESIRSIGDALQRTKEHLLVWKYKRSQKIIAFFIPMAVISQLQRDQQQLNHQLLILLTSLAVVGYFRDHIKDAEQSVSLAAFQDGSDSSESRTIGPIDELADMGAREFWGGYIGAKVNFATTELFCARLNMWYGNGLPKYASDRIVMLLDEYNWWTAEKPPPLVDAFRVRVAPGDRLTTPLLTWIDDRPANNAREVQHAQLKGIWVIELSSTAVAKAWVDANSDFLRNNDDPSRSEHTSIRLPGKPFYDIYEDDILTRLSSSIPGVASKKPVMSIRMTRRARPPVQ